MSKRIDLSQPLSDEDRQYLLDRCDTAALAENEAIVAGEVFAGDAPAPDPVPFWDPGADAVTTPIVEGVSPDGGAAASGDDSAAVSGGGDVAVSTE